MLHEIRNAVDQRMAQLKPLICHSGGPVEGGLMLGRQRVSSSGWVWQ